jgi:hypothetical protein
MHSLRASLIHAVAVGVLVVLALTTARRANAAPDDVDGGASCVAVQRDLATARATLDRCETERKTASDGQLVCSEQLTSSTATANEQRARSDALEASRNGLCSEAASFVQEVLAGHVTNVGTCVPGPLQVQLSALLRSWDRAGAALAQLAAYGAGETDTLPTVTGQGTSERLVARLLGPANGEPLFYRRLLTEALKLTAPNAWARLHAAGPAALDAWFATTGPLDADLVEEAQRLHGPGTKDTEPSLSTATRLVQSYQLVAHCRDVSPSSTCTRARQLQQLLVSTGPLLMRRRVEDIWATDCGKVTPDLVQTWVQDSTTPHVAARPSDFGEVTLAGQAKLLSCFLRETTAELSFAAWLERKLPPAKKLDARTLARVDELRLVARPGTQLDDCAQAARALQRIPIASTCAAPAPELREPIRRWSAEAPSIIETDVPLAICTQYARLLWEGKPAVIPPSFASVPTASEVSAVAADLPETPIARLRLSCQDRHGTGAAFLENVKALASIAHGFGESPDGVPWRVDPGSSDPVEAARFAEASTARSWVRHLTTGETSCHALGLGDARCQACLELPRHTLYDCDLQAQLDAGWTRRTRLTVLAAGAVAALVALFLWATRLARARRRFALWAEHTRERLAALGLTATADRWRFLFPSRHDVLTVQLPTDAAWERWGAQACVVRVLGDQKIQDRDVVHAVRAGERTATRVIFLLHDDAASLDLGAVRALLDWAGKGGTRAVHVLPLALSRLDWAVSASDLLDLVEQTSLRGNPFEVRGRIASSSQFWNRERLVSGLLAAARGGGWEIITGLRRFGKSSLALEVARRLPGPSAYVDLAGFHHEIAFLEDPSHAVNAVLRSLCERLADSARALYPVAEVPDPPAGEIDAAALTRWVRALSLSCTPYADGRPPPMLLVLDELEQALAVGPERLARALDVLAILLGRLRNAFGEVPHPESGSSVGVLLCAAVHPLLWAPLRTLGQQSIMGAFPSLSVPCLSPDAASSMMRGLGARQGIRFTEEALDLVIRESQGVPLLLRRLGTSLLELYDTEHARQGSLGAVQLGIEGARETVEREEREGSPLRVWVESEIAESTGPAGAMLRALATEETASAASLRALAEKHVMDQFQSSGIAGELAEAETRRRAQEAASVILRLLHESGLLLPIGDLTSPEAYALPDGSIRRILRLANGNGGSR